MLISRSTVHAQEAIPRFQTKARYFITLFNDKSINYIDLLLLTTYKFIN